MFAIVDPPISMRKSKDSRKTSHFASEPQTPPPPVQRPYLCIYGIFRANSCLGMFPIPPP